MRRSRPLRLLFYTLLGALIGGILGGWLAVAIGLVLLPIVVLGAQGLHRQLKR